MKISRIAQLGAVGAIAALALAGCASNEGSGGESSATVGGPHSLRRARRHRLVRAGGRASRRGPPGSRPPTPTSPSPTTPPAPARAASRSRPAPSASPAPTARSQLEEIDGRPVRRLRRGHRHRRAPRLHLADRGDLQHRGRRLAQPRCRDHRGPVRRHDHELERPGDRRAQRGRRRFPTWPSRRCTAPTTRARPRTSPTTSFAGRPRRVDLRARRRVAAADR